MKILVIGDLHGRKPLIKTKDFDAFVLVGDICDDRKIGKLYKEFFQIIKEDKSIGFEEFVNKKIGKKLFDKYEKESLEVGRKILKYLDSFGKPIFIVEGNWDQSYGKTKIKNIDKDSYNNLKYFYDSWMGDKINPRLTNGIKNLKNCMLHHIEYNEINFIGYGLSSGPERIKKKYKKEIGEKKFKILLELHNRLINKLYNLNLKRNKKYPTIFISHNIPYKTKLDVGKDKKSYAYKKHLGSIIARNFCKKFQPMVCIGGHVHEGKGKDKIGKTMVINPGFTGQVLIDIDENNRKIKNVKFLK